MVTLTTRQLPTEHELPIDGQPTNGRHLGAGLALLGEETAKDLVQLFKLLADETRLRILYFLVQQDELNVRTLC
jgi:hypothetical protein